MPWKSVKQARWGHSPAGIKALGSGSISEYDAATPKGSLADTKRSAKGSEMPDNWIKRAMKSPGRGKKVDKKANPNKPLFGKKPKQ